MPEIDLKGRTAFVTGASSGLGRHFAKELAGAGAAVAVSARRVDRLNEVRAEIEQLGGRSAAIVLDVTDATRIAPALDEAEAALGSIDILVNNAGMNVPGPSVDLAVADFDRMIATDLRGPFLLAREMGRRMIARKQRGRIVNIGSIGSFRVLPGMTAYCIAKAGIAMMTQCLAREWVRHDITVNAICPGYIETELNDTWFNSEKGREQIRGFPRRRLERPEDLDGLLLLLASDASRAITGSVLTADDAQSL
ncbi:MAG: SDR family NAD(P)-dependent oxidoreductase [Rhizomicrobium sp.]|jgi:NAD(P)-dependent dehydrogenase (short-subunit alcohol dehydrogenase family)